MNTKSLQSHYTETTETRDKNKKALNSERKEGKNRQSSTEQEWRWHLASQRQDNRIYELKELKENLPTWSPAAQKVEVKAFQPGRLLAGKSTVEEMEQEDAHQGCAWKQCAKACKQTEGRAWGSARMNAGSKQWCWLMPHRPQQRHKEHGNHNTARSRTKGKKNTPSPADNLQFEKRRKKVRGQ